MPAVLILTTVGNRAEADAIADALVKERLAACVQLDSIESCYRWQGKVERAEEVRLQIKTSAAIAGMVEQRIRALHSYELPEIVVLPLSGGSADYLAWIEAQVRAS